MNRLITTAMIAALLGCTACADNQTKTAAAENVKFTQLSYVKWDEVTAASSAAHVTNNNLIMMR